MSVSIHLDWLRATFNYPDLMLEERALAMARYPLPQFDYTGEIFTPGQGYNRGRKLNAGSITWHTEHREQGIGVMHTASDLQEIRKTVLTEQEYLVWMAKRGARISTMDACINVHDEHASPIDIITAQHAGKLITRAKMIGLYSSSTKVGTKWLPADTVYIGSPKSDIQVTVYNKAAEQGLAGDWCRIEVTWRGIRARQAHSDMLTHGIGAVTRGAIHHQIALSSPWWQSAMLGDTSPPEHVRHDTTGRFKWLKESVLPALEKEIKHERALNSDAIYEIYVEFINRMRPK